MLVHDLGVEVLRIRREHLTRPTGVDRGDLIADLVQIERIARTNGLDPMVPTILGLQSDILLTAKRPDEAIAAAERGVATLKTARDREQATELFVAHAEALAAVGRWKDVTTVCREGIEIVERRRRRVSPLTLASAYINFRVRLYELAIRAAVVENDIDYALSVAELVKCRSLTSLRQASGETTTNFLDLQSEFQEICRAIDATGPDNPELNTLRAKRGALWDLMTIERLRSRGAKGSDFAVGAVRKNLSADEAVLYYFWIGQSELLIVVLDSQDTRAYIESVTPGDRERLLTFGQAVLNFSSDSMSEWVTPDRDLADRLVPSWAREFLRGKQRLLISPHRMLHSLPFHALVLDGQYVIQRYAVTYVPNLTSLLWRLPAHSSASALLVAAPLHVGRDGKELPFLKDALEEVQDLAALYEKGGVPVTKLLSEDATEDALHALAEAGELQDFSILHFACHGENIDEDVPMESKLYMRHSALDGLEIASWNLRADILVLSACASGQRPIGGRDFVELPGDELFGLQAAFFIAGARQIVSALWPVQSWAARTICVSFHAYLQRMSAELALQRALTDFLDTAGPLSSEPAVWAPFFLVRAADTRAAADH